VPPLGTSAQFVDRGGQLSLGQGISGPEAAHQFDELVVDEVVHLAHVARNEQVEEQRTVGTVPRSIEDGPNYRRMGGS
jgi:hypothetical protein